MLHQQPFGYDWRDDKSFNSDFYMIQHPLSDFKYCPHCGAPSFAVNDAYSKRCRNCNFVFYANAAAATVAVIINSRNELLCVRRDREPARGTLDLPGGFVDPGEGIVDGLVREVKEEVNGLVSHIDFLFSIPNVYPYSGHEVHTVDAFFSCSLRNEDAVAANDDAAECLWIPLSQVEPSQFGLHSIRCGVEQLLQGVHNF